jgi:hypothetical protein
LSKDGPSQSKWSGFTDKLESGVHLAIGVDVNAEHRAKDFLVHDAVLGVTRLNDSWLHKVANTATEKLLKTVLLEILQCVPIVVFSTSNNLQCRGAFGFIDVALDPLECFLVNDSRHEGVKFSDRSNFELISDIKKPLFDLTK